MGGQLAWLGQGLLQSRGENEVNNGTIQPLGRLLPYKTRNKVSEKTVYGVVWMSAPSNSYAEILTTTPQPHSNVARRALGRCLGHEGGAFMVRVRVLIRDPLGSLTPSTICGYRENVLAVNQEAGGTQPWLVPWSLLQKCEKWPSAVCKPPSLWDSVRAARMD